MSNPDKYITERELDCILDKNGAVQGRPGCDGRDGKDGQEGPRGERGAQGPEGKQGCQGERGPEGRRGERGLDGKDGCDGKDGRDGRDGEEGREGPIGPQGQKGQDGKDGRDGCCGDEGTPGTEGPQGPKGDQGERGEQGPMGLMGVKGDTGEQGPQGDPGPKGDTGDKGDKGDPGETGATGPAGQDGVDGIAGGQGLPGTNGADGVSPTITCTQPTETTLALTIVDVNGTQTKTLDVGAGGSTGLDAAAVQTLIDASNCCITGVTGPDANGTYTIQQTNGANYTFTVAPSTGGGLTQTQVQALIDQTIANMSVQCVQTATGFNVQVVSNGAVVIESSQACTWPSTGSGNVTCVTAADPANPCLERTTLTVDGTPCYLVPYGNPECCACRCVTVTAGTTVTVTGTSQDGFSVDWEENNQVTQVAGGVGGTAVYQFNTAGTYTISICLNSYCDTLSDWSIVGPSSMEMKPCDGCN